MKNRYYLPLAYLFFISSHSFSQSIDAYDELLKKSITSEYNIPIDIKQSPKSGKDYKSKSSLVFPDGENNFYGLRRFGDSFFLGSPSTFLPINDPSATSGYILDVDDEVLINLLGDNSDSYKYKIDRSGNIFINGIGNINIAGLTLEETNLIVNNKVREYFVGTTAVVSLNEVRDIQVLVTGHVKNPGVYTVSGYSNILHTLILSGGISNNGSYRKILLKRIGADDLSIDLYDFFIRGDVSSNVSLRSGDSIIVSSTRNNIPIIGAVSRPAIYEFLSGETIEDLLDFSGGLSQHADGNSLILSRSYNNSNEYQLLEVSKNKSLKLVQNDRIYVDHKEYQPNIYSIAANNKFINNFIEVSGEVQKPGLYYIQDGENLSDLISKFGGYTDRANISAGIRISESARKKEIDYNNKLYNEALKSILTLNNDNSINNVSSILDILEKFKNIEPTGRVVTEFDHIKIKGDPSLDSSINYGDKIHIPSKNNSIFVFGEVINPGTVLHKYENKLDDYIKFAGGLTPFANKHNIIVVKPNGETYRSKQMRTNIFAGPTPAIEPGSVIYISRDIGKIDGLELASTISPIFSSLAISLASINSINRN